MLDRANFTVSLFGTKRRVRPIGVPICLVLMIPAFAWMIVNAVVLFVLMIPAILVGFLFAERRR